MLVTASVEHRSRRAAVPGGTSCCSAHVFNQPAMRVSSERSLDTMRRAGAAVMPSSAFSGRPQCGAGAREICIDGNQLVDTGHLENFLDEWLRFCEHHAPAAAAKRLGTGKKRPDSHRCEKG